uniref:Uncharacterized protein n=1 Tax=viral metagenome TaxID=1070528 RepID=A0A6H1Z8B2_9ZZZZ
MPTNLRLTSAEQDELRKKAIEINKLLVKQGMQPLRDSELAHRILEKSIGYAEVTASGEIVLSIE